MRFHVFDPSKDGVLIYRGRFLSCELIHAGCPGLQAIRVGPVDMTRVGGMGTVGETNLARTPDYRVSNGPRKRAARTAGLIAGPIDSRYLPKLDDGRLTVMVAVDGSRLTVVDSRCLLPVSTIG